MAVVAALFAAAVFAVCLKQWPIKSSADAAAWAQAGTTVAVVVVALFMPAWQHERERTQRYADRAHERARRMESAFQLCYAVRAVCEKVAADTTHQPQSTAYFRDAEGQLNAIRAMLGKFAPEDFDGHKELAPAVNVMSIAEGAASQLRFAILVNDNTEQSRAIHGIMSGYIAEVTKYVGEMKAAADEARKNTDLSDGGCSARSRGC
ncbi:hypothetical protein JJB11_07525 [Ramlibacter ginsenosidimutans]|uniref:Uncharacterized protein n=1 Tax=Ramlibacter ginsenosidimutans TaxID=502333 RepID=A0A934WMA0_9BURK|nr:hypothetical protein [Ramlibacter ginsenosidimutans]MBK6005942.1 hypothetical protein [Ramlibacter ginsenosidimutans]